MFFYKNLEKTILNRYKDLKIIPDEVVIISGYLGPSPLKKLNELPDNFSISIIGGMYSNGIDSKLLQSLRNSLPPDKKVKLSFTQAEVHSKIYIWKHTGKIIDVLIGSANFSNKGLNSDFRETLVAYSPDNFLELQNYLSYVESTLTQDPEIYDHIVSKKNKQIKLKKDVHKVINSYDFPLFSTKEGEKIVPAKSGLNWGNSDGHVSIGDAYIAIPAEVFRKEPNLIPIIPPTPYTTDSNSGRRKNYEPIEIIWDDGTVMEGSIEGSRPVANINLPCPKQISSHPSKNILGHYLRERLFAKVFGKKEKLTTQDLDYLIKYEDLEEYGRDNITISLIQPGVYYADFSV